jgi:hypothetical protein
MFKILPAAEKEFDMKEVDAASPGWLKIIMLVFVMLIIFGAVWADWASACASDGYGCPPEFNQVPQKISREDAIYDKLWALNQKLDMFREDSMTLVLDECRGDFYCSMTQMYALQHIIRYYQDFNTELAYETRTSLEIAPDFEALNEYLEANGHKMGRTYDFVKILDKYKQYLADKGV